MSSKKYPLRSARRLYKNFRVATILILIPFVVSLFTLVYVFGNLFAGQLGTIANNRLTTTGWESAQSKFEEERPTFETKFSYYLVKPSQTPEWIAEHFSVSMKTLQALNPGTIVPGTTIKIPPTESALAPITVDATVPTTAVIGEENNVIYVENSFRNPRMDLNMPKLMEMLAGYDAVEKVADKHYRITKPISIEENIRLDITGDTARRVELVSDPDFAIIALMFRNSDVLIKDSVITTVDRTTNQPDTDYKDGRSFVRAYGNSRMDLVGSQTSYLGMGIGELNKSRAQDKLGFLAIGGVYGMSWRIPNDSYGQTIVAGWVEDSTFEHNYIGGYTYGASGMTWKNSSFAHNVVYGLDPHDDTNNSTIVGNTFDRNGKHGFIVSKRCNYNIIKNNVSTNNKGHGYMLHADSGYNVMENNLAVGNEDNFAIYGSSFNLIRSNKSYVPRGSHIRLNARSHQNYIENNFFYGSDKGIYAYDNVNGLAIAGNTFFKVRNQLVTANANRVLYSNNQSEQVGYSIPEQDRVVFGVNNINGNLSADRAILAKYQK